MNRGETTPTVRCFSLPLLFGLAVMTWCVPPPESALSDDYHNACAEQWQRALSRDSTLQALTTAAFEIPFARNMLRFCESRQSGFSSQVQFAVGPDGSVIWVAPAKEVDSIPEVRDYLVDSFLKLSVANRPANADTVVLCRPVTWSPVSCYEE